MDIAARKTDRGFEDNLLELEGGILLGLTEDGVLTVLTSKEDVLATPYIIDRITEFDIFDSPEDGTVRVALGSETYKGDDGLQKCASFVTYKAGGSDAFAVGNTLAEAKQKAMEDLERNIQARKFLKGLTM